jgi:uncharacterized protein with NRDE domain
LCTILFSFKEKEDYPLILLANRDEFYERETRTAHWWDDHPNVLGGRDLKAGGTWMGITKNGRFAAITNYRKLPLTKTYSTSRGDLVKDFLTGNQSGDSFMNFLEENREHYEGYNLIFGMPDELYYHSNRGEGKKLSPGLYGLSNHLLDTPWFKVEKGKERLSEKLQEDDLDTDRLFGILSNTELSPDDRLPDTGLDYQREKIISSIFIESPGYGTRLSSVLSVDSKGEVDFHERSFIPKDKNHFRFKID